MVDLGTSPEQFPTKDHGLFYKYYMCVSFFTWTYGFSEPLNNTIVSSLYVMFGPVFFFPGLETEYSVYRTAYKGPPVLCTPLSLSLLKNFLWQGTSRRACDVDIQKSTKALQKKPSSLLFPPDIFYITKAAPELILRFMTPASRLRLCPYVHL